MRMWVRFAVGFVIGLLLSGCAFALAGAGHGSYVPLIANFGVLMLIPAVGILMAFFWTPFLWAIYFTLIPTIKSRVRRVIVIGSVVLLHLAPAIWFALDESSFMRELKFAPGVMICEASLLLLGFVLLSVFSVPKEV